MNHREIAQEVLTVLERGWYRCDTREVDIADVQRLAVERTKLYTGDALRVARFVKVPSCRVPIRVVDGTTQVVAQSMANHIANQISGGHLALLNFASARNPGGGFLNGAKAQEEDLCRCSGLYPCLTKCMEYYEVNRQQDSTLYTDDAIFSPDVPFVKVRGTGDYLQQFFVASVITAPAPNTKPFLRSHPGGERDLHDTFLRRWQNVLCIARDNGVTHLLLGAWGCGAFGGDPDMAARTAERAIADYGGSFDEIVFAIPDSGRQSSRNFEAFLDRFVPDDHIDSDVNQPKPRSLFDDDLS